MDRRVELVESLPIEVRLEKQAVLRLELDDALERQTTELRIHSQQAVFVWDELGWEHLSDDLEGAFSSWGRNVRGDPPFEYEYVFRDDQSLPGIVPGVSFEVSAIDATGRALRSENVVLAPEETRTLEWATPGR